MALTSDDNPEPTTTAVVTVRIPSGTDSDLVTDAEERLLRAENIDRATVGRLHSVDPKLSATIITVGVALRWTTAVTDAEVRRRLARVPGLASVEQIG